MVERSGSSSRVFFSGLNELRAIAALMVLVHHVELYKHRAGDPSLFKTWLRVFIAHAGKNGVYIFFVLSGFLITYLLLEEKHRTGTISLKKFYLRRAYRIWPLYYLIVVISFFILPVLAWNIGALQAEHHYFGRIELLTSSSQNFLQPLGLFLLFLPNLAIKWFPAVVGAAQTWSVGVEEQFYLLWPVLIKHAKKKLLPLMLIALSLLPIVVDASHFISPGLPGRLSWWLSVLPINFMACGGIGAYLYFFHRDKIERLFTNSWLFGLNSLVLLASLFMTLNPLYFAIISTTTILFIIQESFRYNLRCKWLDNAGTISYGIYMYHPTIMFLSFAVINSLALVEADSALYHVAAYLVIVPATLAVSRLSYHGWEKKFIRIKNQKHTVIESGKPVDGSNPKS
ncbi:MAG: acyltransferase [Vulcanimicrobiota bacterium]